MKNKHDAEVLAKQLHEEEQFKIQRMLQDERENRKTQVSRYLKTIKNNPGSVVAIVLLTLLIFLPSWMDTKYYATEVGIIDLKGTISKYHYENADDEYPDENDEHFDALSYAEIERYSRRSTFFSKRETTFRIRKIYLPNSRVMKFDSCELNLDNQDNYIDECFYEHISENDLDHELVDWSIKLISYPLDHKTACNLPVMKESDNLYCY